MMKVPQFKDPAVTKFLTEHLRELDRQDKDVLYSNKANRSLLLYALSKAVFELTVNNAGELVITKVRSDERPPLAPPPPP